MPRNDDLDHANDDTLTADLEAIDADTADDGAGGIEVPWNPTAAEAEEVELPTLWLSIRAVTAGDGDAPALVNVAAVPKPSGPVKLAVEPMDGAGREVQTLTMPRETYLALCAALVSCRDADRVMGEERLVAPQQPDHRGRDPHPTSTRGDRLPPDIQHHLDGLLAAFDRQYEERLGEQAATE